MRQVLLLVLYALSCGAYAQTPEQTVQNFVSAYNRRDLQGAAQLVIGGKLTPDMAAIAAKETQWPTYSLTDLKSTISGSNATVTYRLSMDGNKRPPQSESLNLTKVGDRWMIKPVKPDAKSEWVLMTMSYIFSHPESMKVAQGYAKSTSCLSNVKQLCMATLMCSGDMDETLKMTSGNWKNTIMPYCRNQAIFTCPDDPKGTQSYSFNAKLANVNLTKIKSPAATVMVYEGKGGKLNFRHQGRAAVGFCDGHAKLISKAEANKLVWR